MLAQRFSDTQLTTSTRYLLVNLVGGAVMTDLVKIYRSNVIIPERTLTAARFDIQGLSALLLLSHQQCGQIEQNHSSLISIPMRYGLEPFYLNVMTLIIVNMLLPMPGDCSQGLKEPIVSHARNFYL